MTAKGVKIQFSVSGSGITEQGTFLLQSRDHQKKADKDESRAGNGSVAQVTWYNPMEEATFTYIPYGSGTGTNLAVALPNIGDTATVTDNNGYNPITGSWFVDDVSTQGSSTGALRVTTKLIKYELF
jgi:hypothetical protein